MTTFPPTDEMLAIYRAAKQTNENILVQALAGSGKTSTLVGIAQCLPGKPMLCIAFNKRIADEMAERLPSHCVAKTMNSIGHSAWGAHIGKRLIVEQNKLGNIVRGLNVSQIERDEISEVFSDMVKLASKAKSAGYVPDGKFEEAMRLIDRENLEYYLEEYDYAKIAWQYLDQILTQSINLAYAGTIDYDDQLYMTTLFGAQLPKFPTVMVDEAQDLSPLNHEMVARLVQNRRLIAVGDHHQAIYGFRGALADGMSAMRFRFNMREFTLSISFRCPKAIISLARKQAPNMKWAENSIEGSVIDLTERGPQHSVWGPQIFPPSCAVISRNNAPLFSLGLKLIRAGRGVTIRGMEISKKLIKILREFGDTTMTQEELIGHLNRWRSFKLSEGKISEETIEDRYACLMVFATQSDTLGGAIKAAEGLFAQTGPVELLSGHKSKGLEWTHVFHLDPWRIPSPYAKGESLEQEFNIEYVITTRSKKNLTLIDLDDFDIELREPSVEYRVLDQEPTNDPA